MASILLIEDNRENARMVVKLLAKSGHTIKACETGEEGMMVAMDTSPDLILADLGLPDIDGQTVVALLRDQANIAHTPIIAFTAWPESTAHEMAKAYGCDGVITKPINTRTFATQLEAFLTHAVAAAPTGQPPASPVAPVVSVPAPAAPREPKGATLNLELIRSQFPALASGAIHLDNPGGTQIARQSLERIQHYYQHSNANHGGLFRTSRDSDAVVVEARQALAEWLNAARPEEIVFGPNMTTLTLHISRSLARLLQPGDEIVLTHLDHDANVAPWLLIAKDHGCTIRWVDFHQEDCTLDLEALERTISSRTKIVAVGYASNAVGTINDVRRAVKIAHSVGALCYVDAVQYVAHGVVDVRALDCDFLVCSAYKFFGPHWGVLYGKYDLLHRLVAYKVRTSSGVPPEKWETGTQSFEAIAGTLGALDYFSWLGKTFGGATAPGLSRRELLVAGMDAARTYEQELSAALISGLQTIPGLRIWGITDPARMDQRVSTVSFTLEGHSPAEIAEALGRENIYVWNGNFYALEVTTTLGLEERGGLVRIGAVHYNTRAEIDCLIDTLRRLTTKHS